MRARNEALRADPRVGVLSDLDLAAIHDVCPSTVRGVRIAQGKPAPMRRIIDWTGCDLTRLTAVICAEKMCTPSTVSEVRKRFGVTEYERTSCRRRSYEGAGLKIGEDMAAAVAYARRLVAQGNTQKRAARLAAADFQVNWVSVLNHFRNRSRKVGR